MKLLIITQKVDKNDDNLGFFLGWIREFAKRFEQVIVICLQKGEFELPESVRVLSLGKEDNVQIKDRYALRVMRYAYQLKYAYNFYKLIWQERKNYDVVFIHMNQVYAVLGGWLWRLTGKKIGMWYAHGSVSLGLRIAEKFVDIIFTSTKEGCRIVSQKIKIVGQGIDVEQFKIKEKKDKIGEGVSSNDGKLKIVTVGRISPSKNYETLIEAVEILISKGVDLSVEIVGGVGTPEQVVYLESLKKEILEKNLSEVMLFVGSKPHEEVLGYLENSDLFVNMSFTGSLDKVLLEAMASGLPVLSCNEALEDVLGAYKERLMFKKKDSLQFAEKIEYIHNLPKVELNRISTGLSAIVEKGHSLKNLISKIVKEYE